MHQQDGHRGRRHARHARGLPDGGGTHLRELLADFIRKPRDARVIEILGQPRIRFTATFTDSAGVQRWVTKTGLFPPAGVPRAGDPAVVWFDPLNPGDETSIIVGVGQDAAAEAGA